MLPKEAGLSAAEGTAQPRVEGKPKKVKAGIGRSLSSKFQNSEHSSIHEQVFKVLHHPAFDYSMGVIICLNFGLVVVETDRVAMDEEPPLWIDIFGWFVLFTFIVELMMRLFLYGREFFLDSWNLFDFTIVSVDAVASGLGLLFGTLFPVSALRVLRLCKLVRVSKVFRVFPELRLMMAGLVGSLRAIFWGSILLLFGLAVCGVIAVQFIHPINKRVTATGYYEKMGCDRCPEAFASVADATLTFSQQIVAGDSWGQVTIPIIQEAPISCVFFSIVFVSIGMAVVNLILGVVVNTATQAHASLAAELADAALLARSELNSQLMKICADMDKDEDGELSHEELWDGFRDNVDFQAILEEMQIGHEDLKILWTILDEDRSGSVTYEEFVSHCYKMKLSDTQFMLAYIKYYVIEIKHKICQDISTMKADIEGEQENMEQELIKMEEQERQITTEIGRVVVDVEQTGLQSGREFDEAAAVDPNQAVSQSFTQQVACASTGVSNIGEALQSRQVAETAAAQISGSSAIESKSLHDALEESRQLLAELCGSTTEIKSRLDLCMPPVGFEPKLLDSGFLALPPPTTKMVDASLLALPPSIPKERCPMDCWQGSGAVAVVQIPLEDGASPGHYTFPIRNWSSLKHGIG